MKHRSKMIVTLSMIWIGAMALASTPEWIRAARDFVSRSSGHTVSAPTKAATRTGTVGKLS